MIWGLGRCSWLRSVWFVHVSARLPRKLRNLALSNSLIDCQLQIMYISKRCSKIWKECGIFLQSFIFGGFHVESVATFLATTEESTQIEEVTKTSQVIYNSYSKWCVCEDWNTHEIGRIRHFTEVLLGPQRSGLKCIMLAGFIYVLYLYIYYICILYICIIYSYIYTHICGHVSEIRDLLFFWGGVPYTHVLFWIYWGSCKPPRPHPSLMCW